MAKRAAAAQQQPHRQDSSSDKTTTTITTTTHHRSQALPRSVAEIVLVKAPPRTAAAEQTRDDWLLRSLEAQSLQAARFLVHEEGYLSDMIVGSYMDDRTSMNASSG
mmetsp:Transcript_29769/g.47730  ORF Transcript_29769/g.47730 Transcript_29769/m.47730 type:complete len:107 (+) Transcript_29769:252-572(+)